MARDGDAYAAARDTYLARFPESEVTFGLDDFSLFALQPVAARLVAGFGRAYGLTGDGLARWLTG
jgi:putative heme iron utilization protein